MQVFGSCYVALGERMSINLETETWPADCNREKKKRQAKSITLLCPGWGCRDTRQLDAWEQRILADLADSWQRALLRFLGGLGIRASASISLIFGAVFWVCVFLSFEGAKDFSQFWAWPC